MRTLFNSIFQKTLIIGLLCLVAQQIYAQSKYPAIKINDDSLSSQISQQYKEISKNKRFGIEQLKQNIVNLKSTDKAQIKLLLPNKKVLTGTDIYRKYVKSTLIIINTYNYNKVPGPALEGIKTSDPDNVGYSSGAILSEDGVCITNYHVLKALIEKKADSETAFYVGTVDGDAFPIENILSYSKEADVAIFKVNTLGKKLQPMPLGLPAETGADIYSINNPIGKFFFFSKGIVARNINYGKNIPMRDRMQITADYARGSSGGPIIDNKGNLVGLVSQTQSVYVSDDGKIQRELQMVFKIVIPVSSIYMLFDTAK